MYDQHYLGGTQTALQKNRDFEIAMVYDTSVRTVSDKEVKSTLCHVNDEKGHAGSVRTLGVDARSMEKPTLSHSRSLRKHRNRKVAIFLQQVTGRGGLIFIRNT